MDIEKPIEISRFWMAMLMIGAGMFLAICIAGLLVSWMGVSTFEGNAGYTAAALTIPLFAILIWIMRAWDREAIEVPRTYRYTLIAYALLAVPFWAIMVSIIV
jgi:hypothetical protein